jgi:CBS domain-containing protein/osmotically-inducible protein OsmY
MDMTSRDVMTRNPSCCVPSDTAARAAQLMKSEDVGPIPVVEDYASKRLVGIVTDRDLALNVVAVGRDPNSMRIGEAMSRQLVTCRPDDSVDDVMRAMADHQVRRIPIVDENGTLVGIVAQADIARNFQESAVGDVVEDISQPHGIGGRMFRRFTSFRSHGAESEFDGTVSGGSGAGSSALSACVGLGLGALAMYLMDPNLGRRRRTVARDKAASLYSGTADVLDRTRKDVQNRASGVMHQARSLYASSEPVPDHKLVDRVRSKMGRVVSHPHAIHVHAHNGHVMLSGDIPADEVSELLKCVRSVPGVNDVENQIRTHEDTSHVPSLQGGRERPGWRTELLEDEWSPAARVAVGVLAGGLLLAGLGLGRRWTSEGTLTDTYAAR